MKAGNVAVTAIPIAMSSGPCISVQWTAVNTRFYHIKFEKVLATFSIGFQKQVTSTNTLFNET